MTTREVTEDELRLAMACGRAACDAGGDYLWARVLPDGRLLYLIHWRVGGVQLSVGMGDRFYLDTWIYYLDTCDAGWRAALGWDGKGEPEGWYRHVQSGRRRPDGDASKEYVQR